MEDNKIEDIYQGGYSSLNPEYGNLFTGYRVKDTGTIGLSTDPRTANILQEVSTKLNPGEKTIELSLIQPEILEVIPKQHLEELNRLAELTGVDLTVHGPLIDASGVTQQGFEEQQREIAERKILSAVEKSHQINPKGNVPVTFHTANQLPGTRYTKPEKGEEYKEFMPVVNQETGQLTAVKRDIKFYPGQEEGKEIKTVEKELRIMNDSDWISNLTNLEQYQKHADEIISDAIIPLAPILAEKRDIREVMKNLTPEQKAAIDKVKRAEIFLDNVNSSFNSIYNRAYKYSGQEERKELIEISKHWKEEAKKMSEDAKSGKLNQISKTFRESKLLNDSILGIKEIYENPESKLPQIFKSAEEYALEKSNQTFGNVAWEAYKKYGTKAPIISIENPPAGMGLSRAEDIKNMVKGSREQFVKNAVTNGVSESQAKKEAEKLIGATWDVGHINQLRQFGFSSEDIIKEAEKVAPYVKHVHLSDNFGMENTELPMGMGNVDLKEVMKKLGKKGEDARKIVEAAHWWQHQQQSPMAVSYEALGSPIYGMDMAPYWNQSPGLSQDYSSGYGMMLPQINYETFGAGFSQLPTELGGQRPGRGGRLGGGSME